MKKVNSNILTLLILLISGYCNSQPNSSSISTITSNIYSQNVLDKNKNIAKAISADKKQQTNIGGIKNGNLKIKNEVVINTDKLDFSPFYYKDQLVFVSNRGHKKSSKEKFDLETNGKYMSLWKSNIKEDGTLSTPELFSKKITSIFHEGPLCFNRTGDKLFFTSNDFLRGKRRNNSKGIMKLQIYTSNKLKDGWSKPKNLNLNSREYEEAHPAISPNGNKLYFSSDRPGGFGGMDLYVCELINGQWSDPENLGEKINTSSNDVFPYVHQDGTLYFSSNGWQGLGGLDIFEVKKNTKGEFIGIENIGSPINSTSDDFSLVMNEQKDQGFFTSARDGGLGQDDIYSFNTKSDLFQEVSFFTYEVGTKKRIEGAEVFVNSKDDDLKEDKTANDVSETKLGFENSTNKHGVFTISMSKDEQYNLVAKKEGYKIFTQTITIDEEFLSPNNEYIIEMEPVSNTKNQIVNKDEISQIKIAVVQELSAKNSNITLESSKSDNPVVAVPRIEEEEEEKRVNAKVNLQNGLEDRVVTTTLSLTESIEETITIEKLDVDKVEKGNLIELPQIYYDFNQFEIRNDAKFSLDKVVALMKKYPSLALELGSHTDARGSSKYNKSLSQNRANEAVRYIIMQGIDGSRLIAKGYGESQLRNKCENYIYCSEEDHQYNRRTEIRVLKIDDSNTKFKYKENMPSKIDKADPKRKWIWN